ncbi:hypothetical protein Tco_0178761 [Tanacetum coccineum]
MGKRRFCHGVQGSRGGKVTRMMNSDLAGKKGFIDLGIIGFNGVKGVSVSLLILFEMKGEDVKRTLGCGNIKGRKDVVFVVNPRVEKSVWEIGLVAWLDQGGHRSKTSTREVHYVKESGLAYGGYGLRRVPYDQRNNPPQHQRIVYPPILNINYFRHFLDILQNYDPKDDETMWAADRVVAPTPGSAITIPETANEFVIKGNHLTLVKGNQFDGRTKTDPHKHIHEFLGICDLFKYKDIENDVVRLMMFPLSLTGEAKTWLDELNEGTIET